jgi:hypothetical protein
MPTLLRRWVMLRDEWKLIVLFLAFVSIQVLAPLAMDAASDAIFHWAPVRPLSEEEIDKECKRSSQRYNEVCREWRVHVNHKIRMETDKEYRDRQSANWNRLIEQFAKERTGRDIKLTP